MRWACKESEAGHALAPARDEEALWSGWACSHCGERFKRPGDSESYELPLMENVEAEDESDVFKHVIETCMTKLGRSNALARSMITDARIAHIDNVCREMTFSRLSKGMV